MRRALLAAALLLISSAAFAQAPAAPADTVSQPAASKEEVQQLREEVAELKAQIERQNELLTALEDPAPPKHRKLQKVLTFVDHTGSVASIASILGWTK